MFLRTIMRPATKPPIRVCTVDDHGLVRDGIRAILDATSDCRVVGEAASAREAYQLLEEQACDVVLMDMTLHGSNGAAAVRELRRRGFGQPVLVLSVHAERDHVAEALLAGASGYALKEDRADELVRAIRVVAGGGRYLASRLSHLSTAATAAVDADPLLKLSPREREIFDLLVRGGTNETIARELFISVRTVETHRTHILRKLDVHSLTDLVRFAVRKGLLSSESAAS